MKQEWIKFEEQLPTEEIGQQVDIFFCDPRWATFHRGMYTHDPNETLRERLSSYHINVDRFFEWHSMMPTHWMLSPELPEKE